MAAFLICIAIAIIGALILAHNLLNPNELEFIIAIILIIGGVAGAIISASSDRRGSSGSGF